MEIHNSEFNRARVTLRTAHRTAKAKSQQKIAYIRQAVAICRCAVTANRQKHTIFDEEERERERAKDNVEINGSQLLLIVRFARVQCQIMAIRCPLTFLRSLVQ